MRRSAWIVCLLAVAVAMNSSGYSAEQYIEDVLEERIAVGRLTRLAVQRHVDDLKRQNTDELPYHFDEAQAKRVIDFKQQLRHTQGEWANPRLHDTRIRLEPWQQFMDWCLFGWRDERGFRRFTKSIQEVARGNGKTTNAAATGNYLYYADRPIEMGPQIYFVGPKKDQGKIAWDEAKRQIQMHPVLRKRSRVYRNNNRIIRLDDDAAVMTVWGRDAEMQDGFHPSGSVVDEIHLFKTNEVMEVIESGLGTRQQPLTYIITTAGLDISVPFHQEERTLAERMLEGSLETTPERLFALIYTLDENDDWLDETVWPKANPNIGVTVPWDYLRDRVQAALDVPSRQNQIITKNFNVWTQSETRWISDEDWMKNNHTVTEDELHGHECCLGLDLSSNVDLTGLVACFLPDDPNGLFRYVYRYFIPEDDLIGRERRDKVAYTYWVSKGLVIPTPGKTINQEFVQQEILNLASQFSVIDMGYDPWQAQRLADELEEEGLVVAPYRQNYQVMANPTKDFERLVLQQQVAHGGHPVTRWMMSCCEVKSDRQGNIMPMKPRRDQAGKRIDGIVASIMATDRVLRHLGGSVYDERGIIAI